MIESRAVDLLDQLRRGEVRAEEVAEAHLQAIRQREPHIQAFLHVDEEDVLKQARQIDQRRQGGEPLGLLAGLPVALKDILCTQGTVTTCASKILQQYRPPYDAHVVSRLRQADAVLLGKTNMDEFAMGSTTENSAFQVTRNPWNVKCVPGGSSGGSAAAVAACEAPLAVGTDTGGSVRQPASFCGVVGLKPTYGRVSRFGLIAFASSLDQVGPLARTVPDVALLLEAMAGHDPRDSTSVDRPVPAYRETLENPVSPLTVGMIREHFATGLDPEVEQRVREAIGVFRDLGAQVVDLSLPHSTHTVATYYLIAPAETSSNLARYDGVHYGQRASGYDNLVEMYTRSRGEGFGPEVKRRIMLGTYALSSGYRDAYYLKALKVRRLIRNDFDQAFHQCDVIVGPTVPTPPLALGETINDPLAMYLLDTYTTSANLAGLPGISVPCGFTTTDLPVGLQLLAPPFEEEKLLRIARMYERATDWHKRNAQCGMSNAQ